MKLLIEVIKLALDTVRQNKVRSFLTVLGVIIGTGTIIAVGSILAGLDGAVTGAIRSMGTNTVIVFKMQLMGGFGGRTPEERNRKPLTYEDGLAIAARCPSVERVSPYLLPPNMGFTQARYKGNTYYGPQIAGTFEGYAASYNADMREGRFFTDNEGDHRLPVAVIGEDVYKALFGEENAIGKTINVAGQEVQVIGVMNRPATAIPGQDDNRILVPYFTMRKLFPTAQENLLMVMAKEGKIATAMDELRVVLRQQRHVPFDKPDNFFISTAEQMVDQFRSVTSIIALVMVVLSSIGLLVGGIGVMNIMLVSVTERTREIGVRKAIGARRSDIILQFLSEAVVLTGFGGLIGMLFGWGVSRLVRVALPTLPTMVPLWAAGLGIAVSVGIGVFFGIWPASKAARLDPVEALRYE
ncbi:MAG: ABC transporter permease [Bryobacterales bacterium]|nr:ABC transporter permease [Bryobacterales bacterium]MBV9401171.1 ABC transporter permease [Bryobacterales bacterium]